MKRKNVFSEDEIQDFIIKFEKLESRLKRNPEEFYKFKNSPVGYLRSQNIALMSYITNTRDPQYVKRLSMSIRNILNNVNIFDPCTLCKVMVLAFIYAFFGKIFGAIYYTNEIMGTLVEHLERVFHTSKSFLRNLINRLKPFANSLSVLTLAEEICIELNKCNHNY